MCRLRLEIMIHSMRYVCYNFFLLKFQVKIGLYLYKDDIYVQVEIENYDSFYEIYMYVIIFFFINIQVEIVNYDSYLCVIVSQIFELL